MTHYTIQETEIVKIIAGKNRGKWGTLLENKNNKAIVQVYDRREGWYNVTILQSSIVLLVNEDNFCERARENARQWALKSTLYCKIDNSRDLWEIQPHFVIDIEGNHIPYETADLLSATDSSMLGEALDNCYHDYGTIGDITPPYDYYENIAQEYAAIGIKLQLP